MAAEASVEEPQKQQYDISVEKEREASSSLDLFTDLTKLLPLQGMKKYCQHDCVGRQKPR